MATRDEGKLSDLAFPLWTQLGARAFLIYMAWRIALPALESSDVGLRVIALATAGITIFGALAFVVFTLRWLAFGVRSRIRRDEISSAVTPRRAEWRYGKEIAAPETRLLLALGSLDVAGGAAFALFGDRLGYGPVGIVVVGGLFVALGLGILGFIALGGMRAPLFRKD